MTQSTRLEVRVSPGASRAGVVGRHGGAWKVRVTAPPEDGRANAAVVRLLAEVLELSRRDVEIAAGHGSRDKVVSLAGVSAAEADRRLVAATSRRAKELV
jgi:uncharacterized protein